ncbi:hypothetical protein FWH13_01245 [Candidatus Saccharibacteria bacterium]|nr:hypothetical protein [Candidatus Saccharibacteria bacterium]
MEDNPDIPKSGYGGVYDADTGPGKSKAPRTEEQDRAGSVLSKAEQEAGAGVPEEIGDKTTAGSSDRAETPSPNNEPPMAGGAGKGGGKKGFLSRLKGGGGKKGPAVFVGGSLGITAILMFGVSTMLPFHLAELLMEMFNPTQLEVNMRGTNLFSRKLAKQIARTELNMQKRVNRTFETRNRLSQRRINQLNRRMGESGIQFRQVEVNGRIRTDVEYNYRSATGGQVTETLDSARFKQLMGTGSGSDANFRHNFDRGTRNWRGRTAAWFDDVTASVLTKLGMRVRNILGGIGDRAPPNTAEGSRGTKIRTEAGIEINQANSGSGARANGSAGSDDAGGQVGAAGKADIQARQRARAFLQSTAGKALNRSSSITGAFAIGCGLLRAMTMAIRVVQAAEMLGVLAFAKTLMEAPDRAKMEDDSPVNELGAVITSTSVDEDPASPYAGIVRSGTEGALLMNAATGQEVNLKDPSVERFNAVNAFVNIATAIGDSSITKAGCAAITLAAAGIGVVTSVAAAIATLGVSLVIEAAVGIAAELAMTYLIQPFLTWLATRWVTNLATDAFGPEATDSIVAGVNMFSNNNAVSGGMGIGTRETALRHYQAEREVIARHKEMIRQERSPFDITSKDTFMGSIVAKFAFANPRRNSINGLAALGSITRASTASLLPTRLAHAVGDADFNMQMAPPGMCPELDSIGAAGNILCQPFPVSDLNKIEIDPQVVFLKVAYMHGEPDYAQRRCRSAIVGPLGGRPEPNFRCRIVNTTREEFLAVTTEITDIEHDDYNGGITDPRAFDELETGIRVNCSGGRCSANRANSSGRRGGSYSGTFPVVCPSGQNGGDCVPEDEDLARGWSHMSGTTNQYQIQHYYVTELITGSDQLELIQPGSRLEDYVRFCSNRPSPFGQDDGNIISLLQGVVNSDGTSTTRGSWVRWLGRIPIVNSFVTMWDEGSRIAAEQTGWVNGENCVAGGTSGTGVVSWEAETGWYAQYSSDVRLYENMGSIETAPTVALLHHWEAVNSAKYDIVDSPEAILAMFAGIPLEESISSVALLNRMISTPMSGDDIAGLWPMVGEPIDARMDILEAREEALSKRDEDRMPNFLSVLGFNPWRFGYRG